MATILLNGVVTDASSISGSDLNDKLTVSGGEDGLSVDLAAGDDLVRIYADSENITDTEIRVSEGDDVIEVLADSRVDDSGNADDFAGLPMTLGDSVLGGPGEDVIRLEDGLVQLSGAVKGNEDDDTIHVANINGGTVNGNAGDDTISIGVFAVEEAGSRAANAVTSGSVMGGQGNDTITVDAAVADSAIRGNEGDDTITLAGSTFSGDITVNGNAGDDAIDASGAEGSFVINGGQGDDTITAGNGQTVKGGLGSDTFVVGASGGVFIEDFDKLDLDGQAGTDLEDCFCDDEIQVQNITFATHTYDVERVKFTSASNWTGDIKVKAVANAAGDNDTAKVTLAATKTETISAVAVARQFITETKTSLAQQAGEGLAAFGNRLDAGIPQITFPAIGTTKEGATFVNGLAGAGGIGGAFAQATGFWTQTEAVGTANVRFYGAARNIVASTSTNFEKPDFSFLQLTKTAKVGVTTNQKLVFSDVTNATVKNHHASYIKVKETNTNNLYTMNFGTANFDSVTTGKAFMVVTQGIEDKAYITRTLDVTAANATAKVTLDLEDTFLAWHKNLKSTGKFDANDALAATRTTGGAVNFTGSWTRLTGGTAAGNNRYVVGGAVVSAATAPALATRTLTSRQLFYSTVVARGEATLSVTARNTESAGVGANEANGVVNVDIAGTTAKGNIIENVGVNNIFVRGGETVSQRSQLVMKIAVSETDTAVASKALGTIVERTTIFGEEIPITTCPDFPTVGSLATRQVDGQVKHGDVVGTFNNRFLWADRANAIGTTAGAPVISNAEDLTGLANARGGDGFFSANSFNVEALAAEGFGARAVAVASSDAQNVPFRVLFFDNDATSNGLYVMSGTAGYNGGALTALNTNPMMSSAMGGKHTIVKVSGGKGSVIELSDINLV